MIRLAVSAELRRALLLVCFSVGGCSADPAAPGGGSGGTSGRGGQGGTASGAGGSGGTSATGGSNGSGGSASGGAVGAGGSSAGGSGGAISGGGGSGGSPDAGRADVMDTAIPEAAPEVPAGPMTLTSTAFAMGQMIPGKHKCTSSPPGGMNISPPLSWTPGPAGTMSYAVTLNHVASGAAHWAIWDIPPDVTSLAEAIPNEEMPAAPAPMGTKQSRLVNFDAFTGFGYLGPCPQQPGTGMYRFSVHALNVRNLTVPAPSGGGNSHAVTAIQRIMAARVSGTGSTANLIGTQTRQ
ncbi:MAG TPA: YbhB/YbcL family Raf kinase inhibitor-like protein [Polyangia bacterium]